jgi:hypothetical protein
MVIALTVIALTFAMGVRRVDSSSWRLDAAGQQVVQLARAARALAVLNQHDVILTFDAAKREMTIHEDVNSDGVADAGERFLRHGLDGNAEFVRGTAPAYGGFTGSITFPEGSVTFLRNGSASDEGAIYVGRSGLEKARVVVISRATGHAEMLSYNGSDWDHN